MKGGEPAKADIHTGKNYLKERELYSLHILCEQFLLFIESAAIRGRVMTMENLSQQFNKLLEIQGHPVFSGYQDFLKGKATEHAEREFNRYQKQIASERKAG